MHDVAPATRAWIVLGVGVAVYDLLCPRGQTMSEGVDRALEQNGLRRAATMGLIGATALHLANILPSRADPFKIGLEAIKGRTPSCEKSY